MKRILITGGAGFAGSNLALALKRSYQGAEVIAFDNLKRRGAELALARLKSGDVTFVHGDVRIKEDLMGVGSVDVIIDCSAEPTVTAGVGGSPEYVIQTNLIGTIHTLELARAHGSSIIFLSTSRVYPIEALNRLAYKEKGSRFSYSSEQELPGVTELGISEEFPLNGVRSLYGSSKLASELLVQEYISAYSIKGVINRCGVLTGPWQMARADQGIVVYWLAKHYFKRELSYIGYGGTGKQFRDILHISDLSDLVLTQLSDIDKYNGQVFNVGGGIGISISLRELTQLCQEATGNKIPISEVPEERPYDIKGYLSDYGKIRDLSGWTPTKSPDIIVDELARWITDNRDALEPVLA